MCPIILLLSYWRCGCFSRLTMFTQQQRGHWKPEPMGTGCLSELKASRLMCAVQV